MKRYRPDRIHFEDFFRSNVEKFRSTGRKKATGLCLFHPDHNPSLSMDLVRGLFHCFACGVGGDIPKFVQLRDNCDFPAACKSLGAWAEDGQPQPKPPQMILVPYLTLDFVIDGVTYSASVPDEPQSYRDKIRRFYCDARDRLTELGRGDAEKFAGEQEQCWERMALGFDELRELENYG